jgi:hypothetical protein
MWPLDVVRSSLDNWSDAELDALDYPLGIVIDRTGLIRYIGVKPGDAFNGDGHFEKVITRMATKTAITSKAER